ncbi:hypothetical protein F3K02_19660 [Hydrogenophaga sp. D2P1]|uniref:Uncharacterized protein n=1 Tax=Hydrogenophaga aromaticivorans TaxID=2610898 RepID=A0A7Y8H0M5_9BURK|nr:hypothetical protein [Hydrogenophaga aromaticivorans]NWF47447.1 hypothetical protein [Hydrogenophaga aromaticivorans]
MILVNGMLLGWMLKSQAEYFFIPSGLGGIGVTQLFSSIQPHRPCGAPVVNEVRCVCSFQEF